MNTNEKTAAQIDRSFRSIRPDGRKTLVPALFACMTLGGCAGMDPAAMSDMAQSAASVYSTVQQGRLLKAQARLTGAQTSMTRSQTKSVEIQNQTAQMLQLMQMFQPSQPARRRAY